MGQLSGTLSQARIYPKSSGNLFEAVLYFVPFSTKYLNTELKIYHLYSLYWLGVRELSRSCHVDQFIFHIP